MDRAGDTTEVCNQVETHAPLRWNLGQPIHNLLLQLRRLVLPAVPAPTTHKFCSPVHAAASLATKPAPGQRVTRNHSAIDAGAVHAPDRCWTPLDSSNPAFQKRRLQVHCPQPHRTTPEPRFHDLHPATSQGSRVEDGRGTCASFMARSCAASSEPTERSRTCATPIPDARPSKSASRSAAGPPAACSCQGARRASESPTGHLVSLRQTSLQSTSRRWRTSSPRSCARAVTRCCT